MSREIKEFVPVSKAAEELGCSVRTLERERDRKRIVFQKKKVGRSVRNFILRSELEKYKAKYFLEVA